MEIIDMRMIRAILAPTVLVVGSYQVDADVVESFSGTGPYASTRDVLVGFDNPGWLYAGDGMFRDGGLWLENAPNAPSNNNIDNLGRDESWKTGFASTIEIRDHVLTLQEGEDGLAQIGITHHFERGNVGFSVVADRDAPPGMYGAVLFAGGNDDRTFVTVEQGPHILLSITFDEGTSQATYRYDNNLEDQIAPVTVATLDYSGVTSEQITIGAHAWKEDAGHAAALLDHWTFTSTEPPILPADFNENGTFDAGDIDLLNAEIRLGTNDPEFDLVADGVVDQFDRNFWVHSLNNTFFGDVNLDGEFNSRDLVAVFQAGHYEDGIALNSGWAQGDWNGNGDFESGDLVVAFQDGGYEAGPRAAAGAVAEPTSSSLLLLGLLVPLALRRRI